MHKRPGHNNKIATGSGIKIKMLKVPFPETKNADLNTSTDIQVVLRAYNNSCILHKDACKKTMINKDIEFQCKFGVVPGNGPAS